jgi:hypothetical protein
MIRMLTVAAAAALLAACGAPEAAAPAAATSAVTAAKAAQVESQAGPQPLGVEPVDMGPAAAQPVVAQAAAQAADPLGAPPPRSSACNGNYTPCVPNDPVDVDCQGGSGNGPSYVTGPVRVTGTDEYGLDADHDGIGCDVAAAAPVVQPVAERPAHRAEPAPQQPVSPQPAPKTGGCNVNYTPCVPNDSDVDCQGGSGNGPSYVTGPVQVTGTDVYGLDADHDGIGCE